MLIINYFSNWNKLFLKIKNNLFNKKSSKDNDKNRLIIIFALEIEKYEE